MTDRHDSPPMTRRELRERERLNALAGRDPSWQPEAAEDKVEPTAQTPETPSGTADPVTSVFEQRGAPSAPRIQPPEDSPFAPPAQPSEPRQSPSSVEHTMTRRQLRAWRAAQSVAEPEAAEPSTELLSDEPLRAEGAGDPDTDDPIAEPASAEPEWRAPALPATEFLDEVAGTVEPVPSAPASPGPEIVVLPSEESEEHGEPGAADQRAPEDDPDKSHSRSFQPPTGHWSIAAKQEEQPSFEDIIAGPADTSGYGMTSSSLVLSSIPTRGAAWSAMGKSGEALKTGSVELPEALSTTGEHARFDTSALDRMFDEEEVRVDTAMVHAPGSEPVRASSAVSSLTSTGDLVSKSTKTSHRLPMALAISAGALAVGVVGLFAAGAILGFF